MVNPDFEAKQIEKASKACTAICLWVRAMHKYNMVAKQVEPKRKLLAEKQASVEGYSRYCTGTGGDMLKKVCDALYSLFTIALYRVSYFGICAMIANRTTMTPRGYITQSLQR